MKSFLPILLLAGCAPDLTADDEVKTTNYAFTQFKDADAAACSHAGVEAALEQQMATYDLVGCAVALGDEDEVLYVHGEGSAELDANPQSVRAYTDHLPGAVASVSKMLTSVALVRLWEDGHLGAGTLDEITVGDMTDPDYGLVLHASTPAWVEDITLAELLSHTSGIQEDDGNWWVEVSSGVHHSFSGTESVDWANPHFALTADELAHDHPGAMPRVALRAFVPPGTQDYDPAATSSYSNLNYLYAAAIIDAVVTRQGFAGYGAWLDDVEPGYESWVWFVWTGDGEDLDDGLYSLALNHPWREDAGEIEGLPVDYVDPSTEAADWEYFGWESGSGGWTLTVGDMLRMVQAERADRFIASWDEIRTIRSEVPGVGDYGLGWQQAEKVDVNNYYYLGHGGGILGYAAGTYRVNPPGTTESGFVAFHCNTAPVDANGKMRAIAVPVAHAVWRAWDERSLICSNVQAPDVVSGNYLDGWIGDAEAAIARYGVDGAIDQAARFTSTYAGAEALEALEAGDVDRAAQCALVYIGDTSGRWSCR